MIARTMWKCTVRRIRESGALRFLAVICLIDYLGFLWLATSDRMGWTSTIVLFIFSIGCWFWAVTWPLFWNYLTLPWQGPGTRRYLRFMERFGIITLFFVQIVYSAIFVSYLLLLSGPEGA